MARTKTTARKSTGGLAPRTDIPASSYYAPIQSPKSESEEEEEEVPVEETEQSEDNASHEEQDEVNENLSSEQSEEEEMQTGEQESEEETQFLNQEQTEEEEEADIIVYFDEDDPLPTSQELLERRIKETERLQLLQESQERSKRAREEADKDWNEMLQRLKKSTRRRATKKQPVGAKLPRGLVSSLKKPNHVKAADDNVKGRLMKNILNSTKRNKMSQTSPRMNPVTPKSCIQ